MKILEDWYWKLKKKYSRFKDWKQGKIQMAESVQAYMWNYAAKSDHSPEEWKAILRKRHENKLKRKMDRKK